MRSVSIIGIGSTVFGNLQDKTIKEIAADASFAALADAGIDRKQIQAFYLGNFAVIPV